MLSQSRHTPKRGTTCQRCKIIRMFMVVALAIAVFAIMANDRMHLFGFVTPMGAALAILVIGIAGFVVKLFVWRREVARVVTSGLAPAAQQEAVSEEIGHKFRN